MSDAAPRSGAHEVPGSSRFEDADPLGNAELIVDPDTANAPLTAEHRTSTPRSLFWFWVASGLGLAAAPSGIIIAATPDLSVLEAVLAILLGLALAGGVLAVISTAGLRTGMATLALSGHLFGRRGNAVPVVLSFLILMGWCAIIVVMLVFCVDAVLLRFDIAIDDTTKAIILAVFSVILVVLVFVGYRLIELMQVWIALIVGTASVILGIYAISQTDWSSQLAKPAGGIVPVTAAAVIALTTAASGWWNAGADFSRFLHPDTSVASMTRAIFGGMSGVALMVLLGLVLTYWQPTTATAANPLAAVTSDLPIALAIVFLVVAAVGLHATAVTNMYSATLNLNTLGVHRRGVSVVVVSVLTIGISAWIIFDDAGFFEWFSSFLTVLGVPLAAWAGVFAAAVATIRSWPALDRNVVVWPLVWMGIASAIGLGLVQSSTSGLSWVGYLAPRSPLSAAGIGVLVALVVAFAGQWATARATWSQPD